MSASAFLLGIFVTWAAIGIVSGVIMGRRGHAPFSWLILGTVLGPLVVPLALSRGRQARQLPPATPTSRQGPVDVIVGIDGSPESIAAATVVARLLGERIGRFTLAAVVDYDTALGGQTSPAHREVTADLERAAVAIGPMLPRAPETVVLAGKPADALTTSAADGNFDVVAVGSRGRGASKLLMGSVATSLSRRAPTPVLIVSDEGEASAFEQE
jgi:nucleotide-binding universal stress UspA family protein